MFRPLRINSVFRPKLHSVSCLVFGSYVTLCISSGINFLNLRNAELVLCFLQQVQVYNASFFFSINRTLKDTFLLLLLLLIARGFLQKHS